jgi:hypothetical protein
MSTQLTPLDDDYRYNLEDTLRPILREGTQRARKHNQNLVAEKIIAIEAAVVALGKALVSEEATVEASRNSGPRTNGINKTTTSEGTFPT